MQQTTAREAEGLATLRRICARTFHGLPLQIVVVDNAVTTPARASLAADAVRIAGDNRCREFSALDCGWQFVEGEYAPSASDIVLLANETFPSDPEATDFDSITAEQVRAWLGSGALVGHVDGLAFDACVFGMRQRRWIKSNFVLLSARAMRMIVPLAVDDPDDKLFLPESSGFFKPREDLSPTYLAFIEDFLLGRANASLWRWHLAEPLNERSVASLRLKARAILSEHRLSARASAAGLTLHDLSRPRFPSKEMRNRLRSLLYHTGLWRAVPKFRARFR